MTSGVPFGPGLASLHPSRVGFARHAFPIVTSARSCPSIAPWLTVILDAFTLWGPPSSNTFLSWYGRRQTPFASGSRTQTSNPPPLLFFGMPSAPGNVPK